MVGNAAIELTAVSKRFAPDGPPALDAITATIRDGQVTGLVGPDGAGKTTLLRLMAGLLRLDDGRIVVAGRDLAEETSSIRDILGYMPQRFGLYEDLSVMENLDLYADLRGVIGAARREVIGRLLEFTGLGPFGRRLAGRLSGGMKQKLGLACALIQRPRILLLDEPGVGVDPLSRRELWRMVRELAGEGIAVVWSTAYLDEAERCREVLVLNEGRLLSMGPPEELTAGMVGRCFLVPVPGMERRRFASDALEHAGVLDSVIQGRAVRVIAREPGPLPEDLLKGREAAATTPRFEDAFLSLLGGISKERAAKARQSSAPDLNGTGEGGGKQASGGRSAAGEAVVEARDLIKTFGAFTAVDRVSFEVRRGEVFGLLGPNGAGKSTTFKMLCGLLRPSSGLARVSGIDLVRAPALARQRMGYMAQKFSLYAGLSVVQNLEFFAGVYGLGGFRGGLSRIVRRALDEFELGEFRDVGAGQLPLGFKQRLSMACATMHRPEILFLDEPTSGVDPITRREFWIRINAMVEKGVAVIVTTHFMDEAEYCDRIVLIHQGRTIAADTPDGVKAAARTARRPDPTLEQAFISLIEESMRAGDKAEAPGDSGTGFPQSSEAPNPKEHAPGGCDARE